LKANVMSAAEGRDERRLKANVMSAAEETDTKALATLEALRRGGG